MNSSENVNKINLGIKCFLNAQISVEHRSDPQSPSKASSRGKGTSAHLTLEEGLSEAVPVHQRDDRPGNACLVGTHIMANF